jgi:uncharacterized protein (TIGR03086 family)
MTIRERLRPMDDLVELFTRSALRFTGRVSGVPADQWDATTPCDEWNVRTLVNHVTYEQLWAPHLVAGETIEQVGDRYDGDVLGADPAAAWQAAVDGSVAAFAGADLDAMVHLSYADVPCREYLTQMLTDAEVHGWDLATATGQDAALDPEAASLLLAHWSGQQEMVRGSGVFGDDVAVPEGADDATRLLGLLGRRA